MKHSTALSVISLSLLFSWGTQRTDAQQASKSDDYMNGFLKQETIQKNSLFNQLSPRSVGPVVMSGRVSDFAVTKNPKKYYASFASGGVFVTQNYGASFKPIFDHIDALGIGDIALSPTDEKIIWVGTGEKNSSRSSYAGSGVYKTTDEGNTWEFMGLGNSQHIGRIVIHPTDNNTVWVASIGPLYSTGGERGVYKTTDGGKTWERTLFINDSTGVIDLVVNPKNPDILYAASWQRIRQAWNFDGSGNGSAIYKSVDGGKTWTKQTQGLPTGKFTGRIGLDISKTNPDIVYALIDNLEETKTDVKKDKDKLYAVDFEKMSVSDIQKLDDKKLATYLKKNNYPEKYTAEQIKKDVKAGLYSGKDIANYGGNANDALFETKVSGAEVYRTDDVGANWNKVNSYELDGVYFTYGYYFGEIRVNPSNDNDVYVLGVPMLNSKDGGKTWKRVDHSGVHVDHQALWINPNDSDHILLGNDGGIYTSFDGTKTWNHQNNIPVGQFYTVNVDQAKTYNIYGGLQDNGVFYGSSKSVPNKTVNWERLMGGDGMHVAVNQTNNKLIYTGFQFGNYYRIDLAKNEREYITPQHDIGKPAYRFNWNTPVILSSHNPDVVYMGSQMLMRSMNRGTSFTEISPDLTTNYAPQGNVPYSTITSIAESPFEFGFLWVGTDDGKVYLSENGGATWNKMNNGLPEKMWVSKITVSSHDKNTAFVSLTGYRYDHFAAYAYMTTDKGKTWTKISEGLPYQPINIVLQDSKNPDLLFAGSDHGGFMSFDKGKTWQSMPNSIPNVAVYDMIEQVRESDLVIATHGRSIYVMDLEPIHEIAKAGLETKIYAYKVESVRFSSRWGVERNKFTPAFMPKVTLPYYTAESASVEIKVLSSDKKPKTLKSWEINSKSGYNEYDWNLVRNEKDGKKEFLEIGKYQIQFKVGKAESTIEFEVKK